jgi:hypothetical protein
MVSEDREFEDVTSQIIKHIERSVDAFKLFLQLFSVIVGGAIWLSIQQNVHNPKTYAFLSDVVVGLVTFITGLMIYENYRGWRGFRNAQSERLTPHVPRPTWRAQCIGWVMTLLMVAASALFCWYNPFTLASK